jgi:hypothetical protein
MNLDSHVTVELSREAADRVQACFGRPETSETAAPAADSNLNHSADDRHQHDLIPRRSTNIHTAASESE